MICFFVVFLKILFLLFLPKLLVHSCVFLVVGPSSCGMWDAIQHGLTSGAMSAPRIRTGETLGRRSGARELNHSATGPAPKVFYV